MNVWESSSWIFSSISVIVPIIILSLCMLWIIRKNVSLSVLRKHHDVAGYTFSIIGVLYSVILGFIVINVQERFNKANETVHIEATMIADLYRDAIYFGWKSQNAIRSTIRKYVQYVIEKEWNSFPREKSMRFKADDILQDLWKSYENIDLQNETTKIWYEQTIAKLDRLMNARLAREFYSWEHLSSMMWTVLLVGAMVTICFMFFFGLENLRMQMTMTALLTGYLAFILYLVFSLDHVFQGAMHVTPKAFEETLAVFDRLDKQT